MTTIIRSTAGAALALAIATTPALAHAGVGAAAGISHGFAHPLGGTDHVLAMVAVGVLAYVLGGRALWLVPAAFVSMMVFGFALGTGGVPVPGVELGIALSSIVIGAVAAFGRSIPVAVAMGLVGVFAIFHGHAHGAEMPETAGGIGFAAGFVAATALLHAAGIALAFGANALLGRPARPTPRSAGGAFALVLGGIAWLLGGQ